MRNALPSREEKARFVSAMFGSIARRYDLMNTLMTAGMDQRWRRDLAARAASFAHSHIRPATPLPPRNAPAAPAPCNAPAGPARVLDVGTGTAKLAIALAETIPSAHVVAVDFVDPMLRVARVGLSRARLAERVSLARTDALRLPFPDKSFDVVVSAFVVRNLADLESGLREQARVLRPGGLLLVLETTPGPNGWTRPLFRAVFRTLVPLMGRLVAGSAAAYAYLPESSARFAETSDLVQLLGKLGLERAATRALGLGAVALTEGRKPIG